MKYFLDMSNYCHDGFKNDYTSCIDMPIAVSAGYYQYDNFFYYLFIHSAAHNWSRIVIDDWQALKGGIVRKLGLELIPETVEDDARLLPMIQAKINSSIPVMMPTKYKSIFYFYLSGNPDASHFIMVSGYDTKRRLVQIRDANHIYESGVQKYMSMDAKGLFPLFMTEDILLDIWVKSNKHFVEEKGPQYKEFYCFDTFFERRIYSMERIGDSQINSFQELMQYFLENFAGRENQLAWIIEHYNDYIDKINQYPNSFETAYFKCFHVILGVIGKWLETGPRSKGVSGLIHDFAGLKDRYMDAKSKRVSGLIEDAKNNKQYGHDELMKMAANVRSMDQELFEFVATAHKAFQ